MTGEGIGQALLTGRLAAEAIIAAGALQPEDAAAIYRAEVAHHLFADHRMSRALGSVLGTSWGARGAIRVVASSGAWGRRNFARWMFEDEPRARGAHAQQVAPPLPRPARRLGPLNLLQNRSHPDDLCELRSSTAALLLTQIACDAGPLRSCEHRSSTKALSLTQTSDELAGPGRVQARGSPGGGAQKSMSATRPVMPSTSMSSGSPGASDTMTMSSSFGGPS